MRRFISFSGGVESTTMCLLYGKGATAIWCDTGAEHDLMYQRIDLLKLKENRIVKVPIRTITITVKDTASLKLAAIEVQKYKDNADKLANKLTSTRNWLLWLVVALAISLILNIILLRR